MKVKEKRPCKVCEGVFKPYRSTDKYCSYACAAEDTANAAAKKRKQNTEGARRRAAYPRIAAQFKKDNPNCEICGGVATDVHHKAGRIGERLTDTSTFMSVCRPCHGIIHINPKESREKGWMI
jgi:tRNA U54 and U55 pseudouridine synthase Pus10